MYYYTHSVEWNTDLKMTAGSKARDDVDDILKGADCGEVQIRSMRSMEKLSAAQRISFQRRILQEWRQKTAGMKAGDCLVIQFPLTERFLFFTKVLKELKARNINTILLVHDLELLRFAKKQGVARWKGVLIKREEKGALQNSGIIIAHNRKMTQMLCELGLEEDKIRTLEMFDYLIPDFDAERMKAAVRAKEAPVIVAGNLRPHKAGYVYSLPEQQEFNLYGVGYEADKAGSNVHYHGSFPPDDLPYVMNGSFGLVWDGESAESCVGVYGEYLRINNPHKTSLYLASGLPVIIWKEAALAEFVLARRVGIAVGSLAEIPQRLAAMSDAEYTEICKNVETEARKLRTGCYLKRAIENVRSN